MSALTAISEPKSTATKAAANLLQSKQSSEQLQLRSPSLLGRVGEGLQLKLTVGAPNDKYEQEADRMADKVMTMPEPVQMAASSSSDEEKDKARTKPLADFITPIVQRQPEDKKEEMAQTKSFFDAPFSAIWGGAVAQRQPEEKEEKVQAKIFLQAQAEEKKVENPDKIGKEPVQMKILQREMEEKKEDKVQAKFIVQKEEEKKEEPVQAKHFIQREEEKKEEAQAKLLVQREEEKKEEPVQAKSEAGETQAGSSVESALHSSKGSGSPLPDDTRSFMEPRFGADFSNVRIHTGSPAVQMSNALHAQAFTHGSDIYFNEGKYNPSSHSGKQLLAHELTHTIQQGAVVRAKPEISSTGSPRIQRSIIDWVRERIAPIADRIPGFTLITFIIGRNPITGRAVERTPINFIRAFLGLIPGGTDLFNKLNESGAIQNAYDWLVAQVTELNITWDTISALFSRTWDELSIWNGIEGNLEIIRRNFGPFVSRLLEFGRRVWNKIKEFIFRGFLQLVGAPVERIMGIINRVGSVISVIFNDPGRFISNLLRAVGQGLSQFGRNILTHLQRGITGWLFGALGDLNIQLPQQFDIKGIFSLVAQILGLTYQNIRRRIVQRLGPRGEQIMAAIETTLEFIRDFISRGPIALWERVQQWLSDLKDRVLNSIIEWVRNTIIVQGLLRLATLFNPIGAIIELVRGLYTTIMFLIERAQQIAAFVESVFNSMSAIAAGNIANAANAVENALSRALTVAISFLASYIGLGGIAGRIREIITRIRQPIDAAIDRVVGWVVTQAQRLIASGRAAVAGIVGWWRKRTEFRTNDGETHRIFFSGEGQNAKLKVASAEQDLELLIQTVDTPENSSKVNEIRTTYQEIKDILATWNTIKDNETQRDNALRQIDQKIGIIITALKDLGVDHPYSVSNMRKKMKGKTVWQVINASSLKDKADDGKPVRPEQIAIDKDNIATIASRTYFGVPLPPLPVYVGKNFHVLQDGHHKFIASRILNLPVSVFPGPEPSVTPYNPRTSNYPDSLTWREDAVWTRE